MAKTPTPTTHQPSFQDGLDSIWKFQLRKENAVLLENQEAQQKMLQALTAESTKVKKDFEERYSALEARLSNLENGEKGDRHAFETWREEMAMMKSQMSIMIANQERQFSEAQTSGPSVDRPSSRMLTAASTDIPTSSSRAMTATGATPSTHQSTSMNTSKPNVATAPITSIALHTANPNANTSSYNVGPMTHSRSRSRSISRSLPEEPAPPCPVQDQAPTPAPRPKVKATAAAPLPAGQAIKIPRLHQGTKSLKSYLDKATTTWMALPVPKGQKLEIDFIALFIKGMRDEDKREILVGELQQQHQSRTKKDGKVEILCKWKDVGQGMKDAELITMGDISTGPEEKKGNNKKADRLFKELQNSDGFLQN